MIGDGSTNKMDNKCASEIYDDASEKSDGSD